MSSIIVFHPKSLHSGQLNLKSMFNIGVIVQQNFRIYGKYLFVSVLLTGKLVEIVVLRKDNVKKSIS